jgi:hypothetical protein
MFGDLGTGNGTTCDTLFLFNATNWYDADYINFKVFMIIDETYVTLSDITPQELPESESTLIYFRIPLFTTNAKVTSKNIQICVLAVDYHFAITQKCLPLTGVKNSLQYATNLEYLKT